MCVCVCMWGEGEGSLRLNGTMFEAKTLFGGHDIEIDDVKDKFNRT